MENNEGGTSPQPYIGVGVPVYDTVKAQTFSSCLSMRRWSDVRWGVIVLQGLDIEQARNEIHKVALREAMTHLLWIDSDVSFDFNAPHKLWETMHETGCVVATGVYHCRRGTLSPVIYEYEEVTPSTVIYRTIEEYPGEGILPIHGCGAGFMLVNLDWCRANLQPNPFTRDYGLSEDLTFCHRVVMQGGGIMARCDVAVRHVGEFVIDKVLVKTLRAGHGALAQKKG